MVRARGALIFENYILRSFRLIIGKDSHPY